MLHKSAGISSGAMGKGGTAKPPHPSRNPKLLQAEPRLAQSFTQDVLVYTLVGTAPSQLAVDENSRHAAYAVLGGAISNFLLLHFMHHHFVL